MAYVVTIARGFGSGGKEIATKLAERLGIKCYDEEILQIASEEYGINQELFNLADERLTAPKLFREMRGVPFDYVVKPTDKRFVSDINLYNIQASIIRRLAETESCIIIGKCADYVLKDCPNVVSFYIEAPREACVESIMNKMGVPEKEAHRMIEATDKYRADYYRYYTKGNEWTSPVNYDMTLNSAKIGREVCVDIMESYVKRIAKES